MLEDVGLTCSVCKDRYSDERTPRSLGCGHALCTSCVVEVLARDRKCPECRHPFNAVTATDFVVNFPLLRLARSLSSSGGTLISDITLNTGPPASGPQPDAGECPGHGSRMFFRCMRCSVWVCRDCVVVNHPDPPRGLCRILAIPEALEEMKKSHAALMNPRLRASVEARKALEDKVHSLQRAQDKQRDAANRLRNLLQEINQHFKVLEVRKLDVTKKISEIEGFEVAVRRSGECVETACTTDDLTAAMEEANTCLEAVDKCLAGDLSQDIPTLVNTKLIGTQTLTAVLDGGRSVYVKQTAAAGDRWAPITRQDETLHLHALRDGKPPEGGVVFPYGDVRALVARESAGAFLDVWWCGLVRGRVYLRMFGNTPRARQTLYLCSGELGPSYRRTCFYKAFKLDQSMESIRGGDYENNDGTGGRAILDGIASGGVYYREIVAGLVVSWPAHETWHLATFDIYLRDCPGRYDNSAHGIVTEGLDTLRTAVRHKPITDTGIHDCGLVIPIRG